MPYRKMFRIGHSQGVIEFTWQFQTTLQLKVSVFTLPVSATCIFQVPWGLSPQQRTVENVQSLKPSVDLRKNIYVMSNFRF